MKEHSPAWGGLDQVAKSGGQKIEANSFFGTGRCNMVTSHQK